MKVDYPVKSKLNLDITPLIDVMFQVIFFLILSMGRMNYSLILDLPKLDQKGSTAEEEIPVISIKKEEESQLYWNQDRITLEELELKLSKGVDKVILKIDKDVKYGVIIKVLSILQKNEKVILYLEYETESR